MIVKKREINENLKEVLKSICMVLGQVEMKTERRLSKTVAKDSWTIR